MKSTSPEVHVISYFSIETDLAADFRTWDEFQHALPHGARNRAGW